MTYIVDVVLNYLFSTIIPFSKNSNMTSYILIRTS